MEWHLRRTWWSQLVERIVFRVVFLLSGWLAEHASHRWHLVVRLRQRDFGGTAEGPFSPPQTALGPSEGGFSEGQGVGRQDFVAPRAEYEKPSESLAAVVETTDILHRPGIAFELPRWAQEIQPFLQNQLSDHTRRAYEADLKQFFCFLDGKLDPADMGQLKPQHIILFRKGLEQGRVTGKPLAPATVNRKLAVVKSFFNWLRANQVVRENPAQLVKGYPQSQESALKGLSDEEVVRILALPNTNSKSGALHHAVLHVLLYLGLRKGELIGLRMGDLDSERGIAVLRVRGKGHRVRILPLTAPVKASLEHYFWVCRRDRQAKEAPLFIPTKNPRFGVIEKPLNPNAITYIVCRYAKKAGILKPISPHSCRATCISNALDRRATHRSVQALAGWSTPLMIQRYDKRREDLKNSAAFLIDYAEDTAPRAAPG